MIVRPLIRPAAVLALSLLAPALTGCQGDPPASSPRPAASTSNLQPLPAPSTEGFEPEVREQLDRLRSQVVLLEAGNGSPADLAAGHGALGMLYHAYGLDAAARACYQNARALAPTEPRWPYYLGRLDLGAGRNAEAAAAFAASLKLEPGDSAALLGLGLSGLGPARLAEGRLDEAKSAFESVLAQEPGSALASFYLGQIAAERGELPAAIRHLEAALTSQPDAEPVQRVLAGVYGRAGDRPRAAEMSRRGGKAALTHDDPRMLAVEELAKSGRAVADRGVAAFAEGRFADAEAAFRQALASLPDDPDAHLNLGSALYEQRKLPEAEQEYRRALELEPVDTRARFNLGTLLAASGRREEAITEYQAALRSDPGHVSAHFNLASSLLTLGRFAEAERHFAAVVEREPARASARLGLTVSRSRLGRDAEARQGLEEGLGLRPGDRALTQGLVRLLAASPDPAVRDGARAVALARQLMAAESQLENVEALAMALAEAGDFTQAAQLQTNALAAVRSSSRPELVEPVERNLALYRAGKPCREPWRGEDFGGTWK